MFRVVSRSSRNSVARSTFGQRRTFPPQFLDVVGVREFSWGWSRPVGVTTFNELPTIHSTFCPMTENTKISFVLNNKVKFPSILSRACVDTEQPIKDAALALLENKCNSVTVLKDRQVAGIITEQDFFRRQGTKCGDLMTPDPICITKRTTLDECVSRMLYHDFRHLIIVSSPWFHEGDLIDKEDIIATLSQKDVIQILYNLYHEANDSDRHSHVTVGEILERRARLLDRGVVVRGAVTLDTKGKETIETMLISRKSITIVTEGDDEKLVGVTTAWDYLEKVVIEGAPVEEVKVRDIVTENPKTVLESDPMDHAWKIFAEERVRNLPVLNNDGKCVGILNGREMMRHLYS